MSRVNRNPITRSAGRAAAMIAMVSLAVSSARPVAAQAPAPEPPQQRSVFGHWRGTSESDGTLDVMIGSNRQLTYEFSGGSKEHATGTYRLKGANQILFTPAGGLEKDEETWTYTFDDFGRLKLEMEEDKPEDQETYVLNHIEQ
jgi:hypothetical protein